MTTNDTTSAQRFIQLLTQVRKFALGNGSNHPLLSPAQIALIEQVAEKEGMPLLEIAEKLGVTAPSVSVSIKRLEDLGMVERWANPADKRSVLFKLTSQGQTAYQAVQNFQQKKLELVLSQLTQAEQDILFQLLSKAFNITAIPAQINPPVNSAQV